MKRVRFNNKVEIKYYKRDFPKNHVKNYEINTDRITPVSNYKYIKNVSLFKKCSELVIHHILLLP